MLFVRKHQLVPNCLSDGHFNIQYSCQVLQDQDQSEKSSLDSLTDSATLEFITHVYSIFSITFHKFPFLESAGYFCATKDFFMFTHCKQTP